MLGFIDYSQDLVILLGNSSVINANYKVQKNASLGRDPIARVVHSALKDLNDFPKK